MINFGGESTPARGVRACTVDCPYLAGDITLDIDEDGRLIGLELEGIGRMMPIDWLARRVPDDDRPASSSQSPLER